MDDVVYLFGIARSEEELQKVANIASNINGVEKVVSHVKVNELAAKLKPSKSSQDNKSETLLIDPQAVSEAITHRTRAIMPVHLAGLSCAQTSTPPHDCYSLAAELAPRTTFPEGHGQG